jgi:hypothetical protein
MGKICILFLLILSIECSPTLPPSQIKKPPVDEVTPAPSQVDYFNDVSLKNPFDEEVFFGLYPELKPINLEIVEIKHSASDSSDSHVTQHVTPSPSMSSKSGEHPYNMVLGAELELDDTHGILSVEDLDDKWSFQTLPKDWSKSPEKRAKFGPSPAYGFLVFWEQRNRESKEGEMGVSGTNLRLLTAL